MAYNKSTKLFIDLLNDIDGFTTEVKVSNTDKKKFRDIINSAGRVLITGTGTSLPVAQYLAARLQNDHPTRPAYFLPTAKALRMIADSGSSKDAVIIVSQGFNRSDSLIIHDKAVQKGCGTVIISGNPEAANQAELAITVPPEREKIFCRPVSPLTALLAVETLFTDSIPAVIPRLGIYGDIARKLDPGKQTVVLYAADVSFAAELWAIMLREGAGLNVSLRDIENYSHGYYGPDTAALKDRQFIILKSDSSYDNKDFARASHLYALKDFSHQVITSPGSRFTANAQLFREASEVVKQLLITTGHDMYGPVGMDENRPYHEYSRYADY